MKHYSLDIIWTSALSAPSHPHNTHTHTRIFTHLMWIKRVVFPGWNRSHMFFDLRLVWQTESLLSIICPHLSLTLLPLSLSISLSLPTPSLSICPPTLYPYSFFTSISLLFFSSHRYFHPFHPSVILSAFLSLSLSLCFSLIKLSWVDELLIHVCT
ncbi:hypothetical protein AALO_G00114110 [Alosa alosa]|uniref:Uncharacterized protein n=1 Tax=Alosa alosa TaxID=278164 RepID=A0AAV6GQN8_9TELE|nr:hypothetical protein AALO_G00114110 [Alosa alosa]